MQRKSLLVLLLVATYSVGCQPAKSKSGSGRDESARREEFQRKVDCEKYASGIRSEWKDEEREVYVKWKVRSDDVLPSIERLFYSPQRNSCVCVVRGGILVKSNQPKFVYSVHIFDVPTKESIWSRYYDPVCPKKDPGEIRTFRVLALLLCSRAQGQAYRN